MEREFLAPHHAVYKLHEKIYRNEETHQKTDTWFNRDLDACLSQVVDVRGVLRKTLATGLGSLNIRSPFNGSCLNSGVSSMAAGMTNGSEFSRYSKSRWGYMFHNVLSSFSVFKFPVPIMKNAGHVKVWMPPDDAQKS
ncbi:uncharacterized protein ARMOST_19210 [Armillaria ostoyae]|uniref:Uncharacterized protein n=1 Tax=Armillaria ostoyae TaxID=47428 RepID=A0A284S412_ARMOS|nr:uncharacterized protein ARMOST_19210 [Armillaria ostoyae]